MANYYADGFSYGTYINGTKNDEGKYEGRDIFTDYINTSNINNYYEYNYGSYLLYRGIPVFIDTEYDTWNMDPVALEKAFEVYPEVKVVMIAHLYGTPGKMDEIKKICDKHVPARNCRSRKRKRFSHFKRKRK